jgi:16S rRNA (cytosine1402-N4)-methyltransferase
MDQTLNQSAFDLVNALSQDEIADILKKFGQERFHYRIARNILSSRLQQPIKTTQELALIVLKSMPRGAARQKIHPATRTFQALRIAVNKELESLEYVLDQCVDVLKPNGRLVVIAFHSLEDKIVKEKFKSFKKQGLLNILTPKPLRPTQEECQINSRSRSARLRAAERI